MSRPKPSGRSYERLTRHERNTVERMLDRNRSAREIAAELGRSPSTVTREVAAHRYVTAPRSRYGEPAPADLSGACPRLSAWPRCCNGCSHRRGYGCSRRPRVFYSARRAQEAADAELSASRSGIDETEEGARVPDAGARAAGGPRGGRLRPHGRVRDRGACARRARPHARLHRQGQGREGRGAAGGIGGGPGHGPEGPLR